MPIQVQHGPNLSRYASVVADASKKTENYERMKQIAEFMQAVKQQNREYELGKKQNELTGRGQDIQYDLGLKDVGLRNRGYDIQETGQNQNYYLGTLEAQRGDRALTLEEQQLAQSLEIAKMQDATSRYAIAPNAGKVFGPRRGYINPYGPSLS